MRVAAKMIHQHNRFLWPVEPTAGGEGQWLEEQLQRYQNMATVAEQRKAREQRIPAPPNGERELYAEIINKALRFSKAKRGYEREMAELDVLLRGWRNLAWAWGHKRFGNYFDLHWRRITPETSAKVPVTTQLNYRAWLQEIGEDVPVDEVPF